MNTATIASAILAAIMAVAMLIPGLNALKASIEGLVVARKGEATEQCYVIVAKQKKFGLAAAALQAQCLDEKSQAIEANFKGGLDMIDSFIAALDKVNPTTP